MILFIRYKCNCFICVLFSSTTHSFTITVSTKALFQVEHRTIDINETWFLSLIMEYFSFSFSMTLLSIHFSSFAHKVYLKKKCTNKFQLIALVFKNSMFLMPGRATIFPHPNQVNSSTSSRDHLKACSLSG